MAGPVVKVGQVWKDRDKRMDGRLLRVERIDGKHAICSRLADGLYALSYGKPTRIRIDRLRPSTGFELVTLVDQ